MPALSALADLAASLGADITAFFPAEEAHSKVRVTRAGDARRIRIEHEPLTEYSVLASRGSDAAFSALVARYHQGGDPISYRHFGERFVYVRSGEGELDIAGEVHPLRPGSFVHYSSHQEHVLRVTSEAPLETVWLVEPADHLRRAGTISRAVSERGVRERRQAQGRTLASVAREAGVSVSYLSAIELGTNVPSLPILARLVHALRLTLHELLKGEQRLHVREGAVGSSRERRQ